VFQDIPRFIQLRGCINCSAHRTYKERHGKDYGFDHEITSMCLIAGCMDYNVQLANPFLDPDEAIRFANSKGSADYIKKAEEYSNRVRQQFSVFYDRLEQRRKEMLALSFRQPYAWLACANIKDVDNRPWSTKFRGRILVHASLSTKISIPGINIDESWILNRLTPQEKDSYNTAIKYRGAIVGEIDIVDCVKEYSSKWFIGPNALVLRDGVPYSKPVPCKGGLKLFKPNIGRL
jgi:hypothetical protein